MPWPRTGIEQPFLKQRYNFIRKTKEFEPIFDSLSMNRGLVEDYKAKDAQRNNNSFGGFT